MLCAAQGELRLKVSRQSLAPDQHPATDAVGGTEIGAERGVIGSRAHSRGEHPCERATRPESLGSAHESSHPLIAQRLRIDRYDRTDRIRLEVVRWIVSQCYTLADVDTTQIQDHSRAVMADVCFLQRIDGLRGGPPGKQLVK